MGFKASMELTVCSQEIFSKLVENVSKNFRKSSRLKSLDTALKISPDLPSFNAGRRTLSDSLVFVIYTMLPTLLETTFLETAVFFLEDLTSIEEMLVLVVVNTSYFSTPIHGGIRLSNLRSRQQGCNTLCPPV